MQFKIYMLQNKQPVSEAGKGKKGRTCSVEYVKKTWNPLV